MKEKNKVKLIALCVVLAIISIIVALKDAKQAENETTTETKVTTTCTTVATTETTVKTTVETTVKPTETTTETTTKTTIKPTETTVKSTETTKRQLRSLGVFEITAYCCENYPHICNDGNAYETSTGVRPTVGRTIAVDPRVIPYGTQVIINGHTYVAEDTGGAIKGNKIDILYATHSEAMHFGRQRAEVFVSE